jgi:hypothetical protein
MDNVEAEDRMPQFLSTLASITATVLAILLAALAAYVVFLQDRAAGFDDKIEQEKAEIRATLNNLRARWPWTLAMGYMPPRFKDVFRTNSPNKGGFDLFQEAAVDLLFHNEPLQKTFAEISKEDSFKGKNFDARVYFWVLNEAVSVATAGTPDTTAKPDAVFPFVSDPGFEEWRRDFEKVAGVSTNLLFLSKSSMTAGFTDFVHNLPLGVRNESAATYYSSGADLFFQTINSVKTKLIEIDKQNALKKPYVFTSKLHWTSIWILVSLASVVGIFVPLLLLSLQYDPTRVAASAILGATLILTLAGFVQFGWDVAHSPTPDRLQYLRGRWYALFQKELALVNDKLKSAALLNRDVFVDASVSADRKEFSSIILDGLNTYLTASDDYNQKAYAFDKKFVEIVNGDTVLKRLMAGYKGNKGGTVLHPGDIVNEDPLGQIVSNLKSNPDLEISIEIELPRAVSRVEGKIPTLSFAKDPEHLHSILTKIRTAATSTTEYIELSSAKLKLMAAASKLQAALK